MAAYPFSNKKNATPYFGSFAVENFIAVAGCNWQHNLGSLQPASSFCRWEGRKTAVPTNCDVSETKN
jgi:hypothetical protein